MIKKLVIKDIKVLFSDKKSLLIFILMPMVLTTILSFALTGSFGEPGKMETIKMGIVKGYDAQAELEKFKTVARSMMGPNSESSDANFKDIVDLEDVFFNTFLGDETLKGILSVEVMDEKSALAALDDGKLAVVAILPDNFIFDQYVNFMLPNRNAINIRIIGHPDYGYSTQIVSSVFSSYFDTLNKQIVNKNVFLEVGSDYLDLEDLFLSLPSIMGTGETEERMDYIQMTSIPGKKLISSFAYYSIAMMAMFVLYSAAHTGRELLNEKKTLTLDRGVVSGVRYIKVLTSKFLMTLLLCFVQMGALVAYATLILGVEWTNPIKILVAIFFSGLAVSGLGIMISAITLTSENYKIANIFENVLIHVFALVGGSYIPLEVLPKVFGTLKYFALNGVVLDLFINTYQDNQWVALMPLYGLLTLLAIAFSLIALIILKRKEADSYEGIAKS